MTLRADRKASPPGSQLDSEEWPEDFDPWKVTPENYWGHCAPTVVVEYDDGRAAEIKEVSCKKRSCPKHGPILRQKEFTRVFSRLITLQEDGHSLEGRWFPAESQYKHYLRLLKLHTPGKYARWTLKDGSSVMLTTPLPPEIQTKNDYGEGVSLEAQADLIWAIQTAAASAVKFNSSRDMSERGSRRRGSETASRDDGSETASKYEEPGKIRLKSALEPEEVARLFTRSGLAVMPNQRIDLTNNEQARLYRIAVADLGKCAKAAAKVGVAWSYRWAVAWYEVHVTRRTDRLRQDLAGRSPPAALATT